MKIESFTYLNVMSDGTFEDGIGSVEVRGKIIMSQDAGGCSIDTCHCSDGHWLTIVMPRTDDGIVKGLKVTFKDKKEMNEFFETRKLIGVQ